MKTSVSILSLTGTVAIAAGAADVHDWSGWTELADRIGIENVPTGADVIVGQVEVSDGNGYYMADSSDPEFDGKILQRRSGGSTAPSSHATMVAKPYFGNTLGLAPGIWFINCYEVGHWLGGGYLRVGQGSGAQPVGPVGALKVWNHSWVGSYNNTATDTDALRRNDWIIERDNVFVAVGTNNGSTAIPLLTYGYNSISVGRRDGQHASGSVPAPHDGAGRMKPEIIGPMYTTSQATPTISAAAAMLVEMVRTDDALPETAERPDVLKAILMAGASHRGAQNQAGWSNDPIEDGPERGWTDTPLDDIYGAGHLDVNRAHEILSAGELDGGSTPEDAPAAGKAGWDFLEVAESATANWRFTFDQTVGELAISASWNRHVSDTFSSFTVADFDLELLRVVGDSTEPLVGDADAWVLGNVASESTVDNVEHIWVYGLEPGTYVAQLTLYDSGGSSSTEDVAIAWWTATDVATEPVYGDINGDGLVGVDDLLMMIAAYGDCPGCPEDINGDGVVNVDDILDLLIAWNT